MRNLNETFMEICQLDGKEFYKFPRFSYRSFRHEIWLKITAECEMNLDFFT